MQRIPWHTEWPYAGMLVLSLALGIALAAGVNAWSESEDATASGLLAEAAAAWVILAAMVIFGRLTHVRLFDTAAAAPRDRNEPLQ